MYNQSLASPIPEFALDPFGMITYGRSWQTGSDYRFGFNGKENINELIESNVVLDLGARVYNCQIGRFFSSDPREVDYPWQTPYAYFSNSPIWKIDFEGEGEAERIQRRVNKFNNKVQRLMRKTGVGQTAAENTVETQNAGKKWMWYTDKNADNYSKDDASVGHSPKYTWYNIADISRAGNVQIAMRAATSSSTPTTPTLVPVDLGSNVFGPIVGGNITYSIPLNGSGQLQFTASFGGNDMSATVNIFQDGVIGGTTTPIGGAIVSNASPVSTPKNQTV